MDLLHDFIRALPAVIIQRLYQNTSAVQAIFESLPSLAQQCCMRLVCLDQSVSRANVLAWVQPSSGNKKRLAAALDSILGLQLLVHSDRGIALHFGARETLIQLLSEQGRLEAESANAVPSPNIRVDWTCTECTLVNEATADNCVACDNPAPEELSVHEDEDRSLAKWERLLLFLVHGRRGCEPPSDMLLSILVRNGLFKKVESSSSSSGSDSDDDDAGHKVDGELTTRGFSFLLQSTQVQLWRFLLSYIAACDGPVDELLSLLLWLSVNSANGKQKRVDTLTSIQAAVLPDLIELGLVRDLPAGGNTFRASHLATQLRAGAPKAVQATLQVEPNLRVCVRGTSTLQISLASLFATLECRLPDLAVLAMSRNSIHRAVESGITPTQILDFLRHHAATPKSDGGGDQQDVPQNIIDQIQLWGNQNKRICFEPAMLYDCFESTELQEHTEKYTKELGAHLWSNQQILILKEPCHAQVKQRVKEWKENDPETQALYA